MPASKKPAAVAEAAPADVWSAGCPSRRVLELVANKWALLIIPLLRDEPLRNNELLRRVGGISQKMLTTTLRGLQRDGFVTRTVFPTIPPRVDYELTELGRELLVPVNALGDWARKNTARVNAARQLFDEAEQAA